MRNLPSPVVSRTGEVQTVLHLRMLAGIGKVKSGMFERDDKEHKTPEESSRQSQ